MNKMVLGHVFLLIANLIYGANYSIAKDVMPEYIKPFGFILLRVSGAVSLFFLSSLFIKAEKIDRKDFKRIFLCALFGVAINQLMFFKGLSLTVPINAAIMMVCTPILVLILSTMAVQERFTTRKVSGIFLGLIGALMLIVNPLHFKGFGSETLTGDIMILINATSWGLYLVLVKPLMSKYHTIHLVKWIFLIGLLMVLPFGYTEFRAINWQNMPRTILYETIFVVVATTFVAYLLNTMALKWLNASVVSVYIYLQPFLAAAFAVALGKDTITTIKIISAIMIISGVYLAGSVSKTASNTIEK
jgi:drug/metabolite transporter (DMT)-like permease